VPPCLCPRKRTNGPTPYFPSREKHIPAGSSDFSIYPVELISEFPQGPECRVPKLRSRIHPVILSSAKDLCTCVCNGVPSPLACLASRWGPLLYHTECDSNFPRGSHGTNFVSRT
jgi:hypothetical protein